ncbi:MAG: hypothetical protein U0L09_01085 [Christensenellales bacterium]|nr:hypothetical protein [Christensenellales bacterium]
MADILIRGMEAPQCCGECPFQASRWTGDFCSAGQFMVGIDFDYRKKHKKCPLLPLPEGHGYLIDRDALKKRTPMVIDYSAGGFGTDGSIRPVRGYGDWQIDNAPTIVPAEGDGENG